LSTLENPKDFLPTNPQPLISQRKTRGVFKMNLCYFSIFFFTVPDGKKGLDSKIDSIQVLNSIFL